MKKSAKTGNRPVKPGLSGACDATLILSPKPFHNVLKAFLEALNIKFEIYKSGKSPYKAEFVDKIEKSKKEIQNGEFTRVKQEELKNFLGLE